MESSKKLVWGHFSGVPDVLRAYEANVHMSPMCNWANWPSWGQAYCIDGYKKGVLGPVFDEEFKKVGLEALFYDPRCATGPKLAKSRVFR